MKRRDLILTLTVLAPPIGCLLAPDVVHAQEPEQKSAETAEEAEKPTVTGRVLFDGEIPEVAPLEVPARAAEGCCPPGENVDTTDLSLVIGKERGILGVVVSVEVEGAEVEIPEEPYEMDQKGCRFLPHLLVVPTGAKVAFLNSDDTSHNVHLITLQNEALNQTVLAGRRVERTFEKEEPIKVICDMHSWMKAWVVVTDATHWTTTDEKGAFSLAGLPPGEHQVTFWHETLGKKTAKVTVNEDGTAEPLEVKMAKKQTKRRRRRR
ncbi:MAG: carboxypeptidase regulatory-like domain-containing protein [Planctomycetota bacterium]